MFRHCTNKVFVFQQVDANLLAISKMEQNKETLLTEIRSRINEMNSRTLYLRKLPRNTSLSQLKALCRSSANGRLLNPSRHLKHRLALMEYNSREAALSSLKSLGDKFFGDIPITVELCSERCKSLSNSWRPPQSYELNEFNLNKLYVAGINRRSTEQEIRDLFPNAESFDFIVHEGALWHCRVIFTNQKDALEAFNTRHGVVLHDTPINLNFDLRSRKSSLLVRAPIVSTITDPKVLSNEKPKMKSRKSSFHLNQQQSRGNKSLTESPSGPVKNSNLEANKNKRKRTKNESASSNSVQFSLATNHGHQVSKPVPKKRKLV
ncbi:unnamed protein product [Schistosoma margrebowiei]|uniref:RRM domain-containing protein n=2 Tax=Schistosoma margrebowiei TaxID=48269 RepID=A0AA85A3J2_9TREM|nr:unnamed protein product [Schistosoma margrebowiei]